MQGKSVESIAKKMRRRENKENKLLEKEKQEKKMVEDQKVRELKEKAFNALKKEGIIPQDQKFGDFVDKEDKKVDNKKEDKNSDD